MIERGKTTLVVCSTRLYDYTYPRKSTYRHAIEISKPFDFEVELLIPKGVQESARRVPEGHRENFASRENN
jgi:hypothetical protein